MHRYRFASEQMREKHVCNLTHPTVKTQCCPETHTPHTEKPLNVWKVKKKKKHNKWYVGDSIAGLKYTLIELLWHRSNNSSGGQLVVKHLCHSGYVFIFPCVFGVSAGLSAGRQKGYRPDLGETWMDDGSRLLINPNQLLVRIWIKRIYLGTFSSFRPT